MQCHAIVLDTTGTKYTSQESKKTKDKEKRRKEEGKKKRERVPRKIIRIANKDQRGEEKYPEPEARSDISRGAPGEWLLPCGGSRAFWRYLVDYSTTPTYVQET